MSEQPATYTHAKPPGPEFWVVEVIRASLDEFRIEGIFSQKADAEKMRIELEKDPDVEFANDSNRMTMDVITRTILSGILGDLAAPPKKPFMPGQPDQTR